jgi:Zn-dependent peptidase ImmA (M78 family)/transcriptional regulator with XRE-family HTH domain
MVIGIMSFQSTRLIQARLLRRLSTVTSLADLSGITKQMLSRYEAGTSNPTEDRLRILADTLNFPMEFFLTPARGEHDRPVFYRSMQSALQTDRRRVESVMDLACEVTGFLESHVELPQLSLAPVVQQRSLDSWDRTAIEFAAKRTREHFGFPSGPLPNLTILCERHGVTVIRTEMAERELDGASRWHDTHPVVVLNSTKSPARSRFDLAHELGHLVMHSQPAMPHSQEGVKSSHKVLEAQAHQFAAALLMPPDEFAADLWSYTLDEFVSFKHKWQVSAQAMLQRAFDLMLISSDDYLRMRKQVSARGWQRQEPMESVVHGEQPSVIREALEIVASEVPGGRDLIASSLPLGNLLPEIASAPPNFLEPEKRSNLVDIRSYQQDGRNRARG